ncbi:MAG: hypothetical protein O3B24_07115 [Verrucomicrobia bacterium]|nr:hypothetical protein [Verrucomicrobiota bacterium]
MLRSFPFRPRAGIAKTCALALAIAATTLRAAPEYPYAGKPVEAVYAELCAVCHGAQLGGGRAASLIDGAWRV